MSTSSQSHSSHRVPLEAGVTSPPFQQKEAFYNPINVQYHHRMVEIEMNTWITANANGQTKAWVSKEEPNGAQSQVRLGDTAMITPCKGSRAYRDSLRKRYYHRMVESEKMAYFDPEKRVQMSFENLHLHSPESPRRVRFRDADVKRFPQDAEVAKNPSKKRYYTRMGKLETDARSQGKNKSTQYSKIGDGAGANGNHSIHALGTSDLAAKSNNSTDEEVHRSTNDNNDEEDAMFTAGGQSFAIMSKSLREEENSFW